MLQTSKPVSSLPALQHSIFELESSTIHRGIKLVLVILPDLHAQASDFPKGLKKNQA